jgi:hypothetical protein
MFLIAGAFRCSHRAEQRQQIVLKQVESAIVSSLFPDAVRPLCQREWLDLGSRLVLLSDGDNGDEMDDTPIADLFPPPCFFADIAGSLLEFMREPTQVSSFFRRFIVSFDRKTPKSFQS